MNLFSPKKTFVIIGFLILLTACHRMSDKTARNLSMQQDFQFDSAFNTVIIKNDKDYPITFRMKINNVFPLEMTDINNEVEQISVQKSISTAQAAWEYVFENSFWNIPYTSENWQHNPLLFLNSLGGGMCDDIATVLASIWKNAYDSVRVVGLEGHVVSEVKENGKWQMFDADNGVMYFNSEGQICSVNELEKQPNIIAAPHKDKVLAKTSFFLSQSPLTSYMADLYATKDNNQDATEWHMNYSNYSDTFSLPAHSSIEISNIENRIHLKVILKQNSIGKLQIPLIPYRANGAFIFSTKHKLDTVQSNIYTFNSDSYNNKINILHTAENSEIIYLINPKLNFWQAVNSIKIGTTDSLIIEKTNLINNISYSFGDEGLFFKENTIKYSDEIKKWQQIDIANIDAQQMEILFRQFLDTDKTLTAHQKEQKTTLFRQVYQQVLHEKDSLSALQKYFPKSILYLFVVVKEDKLDYLYLV